METLEQETIQVDFEGKKLSVTVTVEVMLDPCEIDWEFESEEERKRHLKKYESGELEMYYIKATARLDGTSVIGRDGLGAVDVVAANARQDLLEAVIQNSMKETAVEDLKQEIKAVLKAIGRE